MLLKAYSIYDRKSLAYHTPYFTSTDGAAARSFSDLVNDINTNVGRHPNDYVLYCVGEFDDAKGVMIPLSPMRHVVDAMALLTPPLPELNFKAGDPLPIPPVDFATEAKHRRS